MLKQRQMKNQQTGLAQFKRKGAKRTRTPHEDGKPKCEECGFRMRGHNHAEGTHHKQGGKRGKGSKAVRYRRR